MTQIPSYGWYKVFSIKGEKGLNTPNRALFIALLHWSTIPHTEVPGVGNEVRKRKRRGLGKVVQSRPPNQ
jgi:hypothetical protein